MTPERYAELQELLAAQRRRDDRVGWTGPTANALSDLIGEVERLRDVEQQLADCRTALDRLRPVYEAAKAWRRALFRPYVEITAEILEAAIDAALSAEGEKEQP